MDTQNQFLPLPESIQIFVEINRTIGLQPGFPQAASAFPIQHLHKDAFVFREIIVNRQESFFLNGHKIDQLILFKHRLAIPVEKRFCFPRFGVHPVIYILFLLFRSCATLKKIDPDHRIILQIGTVTERFSHQHSLRCRHRQTGAALQMGNFHPADFPAIHR